MLEPGMHPRSPVHVTKLKENVCDGNTATIHVANTMWSNDTMPYVVISAYPGFEIAQQYDFVILRNSPR